MAGTATLQPAQKANSDGSPKGCAPNRRRNFSAPFEAVLQDVRGQGETLSPAHDPAEADDTSGGLPGKRDREHQPHFDRHPGLRSSLHAKQDAGSADVFRLALLPVTVPNEAVADGRSHHEARGA